MNGHEHDGHVHGTDAKLLDELRAVIGALAERAEPLLRKVSEGEPSEMPASCEWCPLCAGIAVLRGQRPELAVKAAEHGVVLVELLRTVLGESARPAEQGWTTSGTLPDEEVGEHPVAPRVQHIDVRHGPSEPSAEPDSARVQRISLRRKDVQDKAAPAEDEER